LTDKNNQSVQKKYSEPGHHWLSF